jgi:hypothetical protein
MQLVDQAGGAMGAQLDLAEAIGPNGSRKRKVDMPENPKIERVQFRAGPIATQLQQRSDGNPDLSVDLVARRDLERYYSLLSNDLRTIMSLTRDEAMLCCEALLGLTLDDISRSPHSMVTSILDAMNFNELHKKLGVDRTTFTEKIINWTGGQRYAVADAVERWRLLTRDHGVDDDEALVKVGLLRT